VNWEENEISGKNSGGGLAQGKMMGGKNWRKGFLVDYVSMQSLQKVPKGGGLGVDSSDREYIQTWGGFVRRSR